MAYYEITIIDDGAVDQEETIISDGRDEWALQRFLKDTEVGAQHYKRQIDVFVQFHDHALGYSECSCAQYEQSHKPNYTFGDSE